MQVNISYKDGFVKLMDRLKAEYGQAFFEMEGIGSQLDIKAFANKFFSTDTETTADVSVDANSNIDTQDMIVYIHEMPKPYHRLNSYYWLWNTISKSHSVEIADAIIEAQLSGDMYINDFGNVSIPYCFNYSCSDVMSLGLPFVKRIRTVPPKHFLSFRSQLEQFVAYASNSTLGATGLADLLLVTGLYVDKMLETLSDEHFNFKTSEDVWAYTKATLVSFVYTINQPAFRANQCVTEDTEVLTPDGFKTYDMLRVGDPIYTWDKGELKVEPTLRVNVSDYNGEMHRYSGRDAVQQVTPNHKVLYRNGSGNFVLKESSDLIDKKTPLSFPVAMESDKREDYAISDDMLSLCVFMLTDGHICHQEGKFVPTVKFYKSPTRWGAESFIDIVSRVGGKAVAREIQSCWGGTVTEFSLSGDLAWSIGTFLEMRKDRLPSWMSLLSRRQADLVMRLWAELDGHTAESEYGRMKLQCDNDTIADQMQHLCFLAGHGSRIAKRMIGQNKTATTYVLPYSRGVKCCTKKDVVHYSGKVWCPTTETGVVVFRKDGKLFISGNSPFTNLSLYDRYFLEELAPSYTMEGKQVSVETVERLQVMMCDVMNEEMKRTPITFPVFTACLSKGENGVRDREFLRFISEASVEFAFLNFYIGDTSTLSSCCRLRSDRKNEYFNSFGAGSTKIGSLGVVTINLPRIAHRAIRWRQFVEEVCTAVRVTALVNNAKRSIIRHNIDTGKLPLYTHGFMELDRQYSTAGLTGLYEACKMTGVDITTDEGINSVKHLMEKVNEVLDECSKLYSAPHNVEQVPAENSSIKLAAKDKAIFGRPLYEEDGLDPGYYSNQFVPLTHGADLLDRIRIQGQLDRYFSGGAICHLNLKSRVEGWEDIADVIDECARQGVVYAAVNYVLSYCVHGHLSAGDRETCPVCGGRIEDRYTRVVGFLTNVKNWHQVRRENDFPRRVWSPPLSESCS